MARGGGSPQVSGSAAVPRCRQEEVVVVEEEADWSLAAGKANCGIERITVAGCAVEMV